MGIVRHHPFQGESKKGSHGDSLYYWSRNCLEGSAIAKSAAINFELSKNHCKLSKFEALLLTI